MEKLRNYAESAFSKLKQKHPSVAAKIAPLADNATLDQGHDFLRKLTSVKLAVGRLDRGGDPLAAADLNAAIQGEQPITGTHATKLTILENDALRKENADLAAKLAIQNASMPIAAPSANTPPVVAPVTRHTPAAPAPKAPAKPNFSHLTGLAKVIALEKFEAAQGAAPAPATRQATAPAPSQVDPSNLTGLARVLAAERRDTAQLAARAAAHTVPALPTAPSTPPAAPSAQPNGLRAAALAVFGESEVAQLVKNHGEKEATKIIENRFVLFGLDAMLPAINFAGARIRVKPMEITGMERYKRAEQIERLERFLNK